jgi:enoyl-CoA hydratase
MCDDAPVLVQRGPNGVVTVTLNRPKQHNAINQQLSDALAQAFTDLQRDPTVTCVVLTGRGKSFCAGIDLSNPVDALQQTSDSEADLRANPVHAMDCFTRPIIGAINGAAMTGGFEIALACDILIGSTAARFRDTHCIVGVVPCWGLSQRLSRIIGPTRARYLSLSASALEASHAEAWGLLAAVHPPEYLATAAATLAATVAELSPALVQQYKRTLVDGFDLPLGEALRLERRRAAVQYASLGQQAFKSQAGATLSRRKAESAAERRARL